MKKTFLKISAFATIGLVLASCNNEEANKKLQEADDLAVQELVNAKELELDAAVWAECDAKVLVAAEEAVAANAKKGKAVAKKPATKPAPVAETPKEEPKTSSGPTNPFQKATGTEGAEQKKTNPFQKATGTEGAEQKKTNPFQKATGK